MTDVSLDEQIKAVRREIAMRTNLYASRVEMKRMSQAEADKELGRMQAVLGSLMELRSTPKLVAALRAILALAHDALDEAPS
jgi:hypothetical protein